MNDKLKIEGQLLIQNGAFSMDGGSKFLIGIDSTGNEMIFQLPQHKIPENFGTELIPGRLHLNGKPIELRSEKENEILGKLTESQIEAKNSDDTSEQLSTQNLILGKDIEDYFSAIEKGQNYAIAHLLKEIIEFVKSDEYVQVANRINTQNKT